MIVQQTYSLVKFRLLVVRATGTQTDEFCSTKETVLQQRTSLTHSAQKRPEAAVQQEAHQQCHIYSFVC